MKKNIQLFLMFITLTGYATTYHVGSTRAYVSPRALYSANIVQNGDIIEIDEETYIGNAALAVWNRDNLIIRGVGGKPHLVANGQYIFGKGIWVCAGNNITVENIEFSGATVPDQNGAGIRLDGNGLTIRYCYFHDNENGILTNNSNVGDILIEYSEFNHNGFGAGFTHNLYIGHVNKLTFRYNYSHHALVGHNLKSRANENYIMYNRIMDEQTGRSSRLIDLPNGGFSIIMGNLLMQGSNAENNNLVGYGLEGLSNANNKLYLINNTLVNKRGTCNFIHIQGGTTIANITNNIFTGIGNVINGTTTTMSNNVIEATISNMNFVDEANYDYHLNSNSPAINVGTAVSSVNGNSLTPNMQYIHPTAFETRPTGTTIDVGAYEYDSTVFINDFLLEDVTIYPNPIQRSFNIKLNDNVLEKVIVFNELGKKIYKNTFTKVNILHLKSGIYYVKIVLKNGKTAIKKIIKS